MFEGINLILFFSPKQMPHSIVNSALSLFTRKRINEMRGVPKRKTFHNKDYEDMKPDNFDGRLKRIPAYDDRVELWNSMVGPGCSSCKKFVTI
jgi:hypothetical protein